MQYSMLATMQSDLQVNRNRVAIEGDLKLIFMKRLHSGFQLNIFRIYIIRKIIVLEEKYNTV